MSLQLLPGREDAGMMGLVVGGAVGLVQCMLGDTGSIFTMAGAEPKHTDGDRTTAAEHTQKSVNKNHQPICKLITLRCEEGNWQISANRLTVHRDGEESVPGCVPCRIRVLAATHIGLGCSTGLLLRMEPAFTAHTPTHTINNQ